MVRIRRLKLPKVWILDPPEDYPKIGLSQEEKSLRFRREDKIRFRDWKDERELWTVLQLTKVLLKQFKRRKEIIDAASGFSILLLVIFLSVMADIYWIPGAFVICLMAYILYREHISSNIDTCKSDIEKLERESQE